MPLSVLSNPLASVVARQVNDISNQMQETSLRLATGKRILSAKDDPAGIGILSSLKSQYASYNAVEKNLTAGNALLDTATSSLANQQLILNQMKDIATQASSDLLSAGQRSALGASFTNLQSQLDDAVNKATIFGQNLTGSAAAAVNIQSGINAGQQTTISTAQSDAATLGADAGSIDVSSSANAALAMTAIDAAVDTVATNQSVLGAQAAGLDAIANTTKSLKGNLEKSIGNIEDVDVAAESSKLQLLQARQQISTSMLSLINQLPSYALQLLR
jgi:flagellin